jgi:two-component system CheB/CheR fusion protein
VETLADYLNRLQRDERECRELFQELLIGVTSFFRHAGAFDALKEQGFPQLLEGSKLDKVRIWVPACSTGEEAYSIAIVLHEYLSGLDLSPSVYIFATDIDERAIARARAGVYPGSIAGDVGEDRLSRYFDHENNTYRVKKIIRDMLIFSVQDILKDPPFTRLDLVSCRNFLIYINQDLQRKVIRLFHYALKLGGLLMLGNSESTGDSADLFSTLDKSSHIYTRRADQYARKEKIQFPLDKASTGTSVAGTPRTAERPLEDRVEAYLLENHTPEAVFLDADKTIVYFHGRTGTLFEPAAGVARTGVLEMAREGLRETLSTALAEAQSHGRPTTRTGVRVKTNGSAVIVSFTVEPLTSEQGLEGMYAVVFGSVEPEAEASPPVEDTEAGGGAEEEEAPADEAEVTRLKEELRGARERLQTTVEELETRNEELQSSLEEYQSTNEELQSSNEELESSKEEMQSLNEELSTVNSELQDKNEELSKANHEMRNFLDRLDLPILVVDNNLRVKRFNEATASLINLIESDINRPLGQVTHNLSYDAFIDDVDEALRKTRYLECAVKSKSGEKYWVRMIPYKNVEQVMEGLLITFVPFPPDSLEER